MPLETSTYIHDLVETNPLGTDPVAFTDEHLRLIKSVLKNTFPNLTGAVTADQSKLNYASTNPFPVGGIILWSGLLTAVPTGWALCDGTQGTPDLRNRFVVGAGGLYTKGALGGTKDAVVPAHSHTATASDADKDHTHSVTGNTDSVADHRHFTMIDQNGLNFNGVGPNDTVTYANHGDAGNWQYHTAGGLTANATVGKSSAAGGHNHTINLTEGPAGKDHTHTVTVASAGVSATDANLPPYLALAYIMKL